MSLENELYEIVAKEIRSGTLVDGLYTRAFSEADGNKDKARARYIKLRVEQLNEELQARIKQAKSEAEATAQAEKEAAEAQKNEWSKMYDTWECDNVGKTSNLTTWAVIAIFIIVLAVLASTAKL